MDPRLVALASAQGGAFTASQARSCGYSEREVQWLRRRKSWVSLRRGVYCETALIAGLDELARHRLQANALLLVLHEPAVLSHVTAGAWLQLDMLRPELDLLHVTRGDLHGSRREANVHHHAAALPDHHVVPRGDAVVTTPPRTALDIARCGTFEQGVAAVDSALRQGAEPDQMLEVLDECRQWGGARTASRAVAFGDGRAANPGESWSRVVLAGLGAAPPDLQRPLYDADGLAGIVDFYYEEEQVAGEFDGLRKYRVPPGASPDEAAAVVVREKLREDRLRDLGCEVVRWGWADLPHSERLRARMARALARGAGRGRRAG